MKKSTNEILQGMLQMWGTDNSPNSYAMYIPNSVSRYPHLSMEDKAIYFELLAWLGKSNERTVTLSYQMLMFSTGIKTKKTVKKYTKSLKEKGYIDFYRYSKNDRYTFEFKPLALNVHAIVNETLLYFFEQHYFMKNWSTDNRRVYSERKELVKESVLKIIESYDSYDKVNEEIANIAECTNEIIEDIFWKCIITMENDEPAINLKNYWKDYCECFYDMREACNEILMELEGALLDLIDAPFEEFIFMKG